MNSIDFMNLALLEARKAYRKGEAPVGAVVVKDGRVIARAHNLRERRQNALYHAEILAIDRACRKLGSWRLDGCDLYVTLEPCSMCSGAIIQARISRLYFGASDPKAGCVGSIAAIPDLPGLTHRVQWQGGILADECSQILKDFFRALREGRIRSPKKRKRKKFIQ